MSDQGAACPTENELLARVAGTLSAARLKAVDAHIDECESCRMVLAEAARGTDEIGVRPIALATFAPNESVAGRYVIKRRLAAGGMGEVYEAHDSWLDELIAIKTVVPTIADNELALARLKAEMRLARRVTHKNVCRVYDLGFHGRSREQIAFLTMELVRGTTLRRRFEEQGPFDTSTLIPIVEQIVAALGHAHAEGIVHRDLKPDNVMLVGNGDGTPDRVVVMDFGLARMALVADTQPLTPNSHTVLGTLDYMSPEQVQGKHAGPASDIYSLGILLFELLTGRLPFEGESPLARALLRVTQRPPSLDDALPGVDPAWSECITRCLKQSPKDRFDTIDEVADALPRGPDRDRSPRTARMNRQFVLPAVVGIGIAAALVVLARTPERPRSAEPAKTSVPTAASVIIAATTAEAPPRAPAPNPVALPAPMAEVPSPAPAPMPPLAKRSTTLPRKNPTTDPPVAAPPMNEEPDATSRVAETKPSGVSTSAFQEAGQPAPAPGNALINPFAVSR